MKAAIYTRTGEARDVLHLEEVDRPEPAAGEVRVRVCVSGVNPTDYKTRSGATARPIDRFQSSHQDGAGIGDAAGGGGDPAPGGPEVWICSPRLAAGERPLSGRWSPRSRQYPY